jgi:diadenosine tetraphosphate (Ap4A) HIT family hydrolase
MRCDVCGFELWIPVKALEVSTLGIYNDNRFPGRSILVLNEHESLLEELTEETLFAFMLDVQKAVRAIKKSTGSNRVNVAILGNRDPHVHAHLIPRYPDNEEKPDSSPWDDPRDKGKLSDKEIQVIKNQLLYNLR